MNDTPTAEPVVYLDGHHVPLTEAKISVFDLGLVQGAAVTEMVRTFGHRPFHLDRHLDRLFRSLRVVGFAMDLGRDELRQIVLDVLEHNQQLAAPGHDLGIVLFVTAGTNLTYVGAAGKDLCGKPTVCVHTFPLPFELWAGKFETGQHLVTPSIRQIPPESLDPKIKSRSRLHWHLADRQARLVDPQAGALLLDRDGNLTETATANFLLVSGGTLLTPHHRTTLGGISQQVTLELAARLGIPHVAADLQLYDALTADEALTTSTPYCLLPVTRLNGQPIGDGAPGPVFARLLAAWNELAGLDILRQMRTGAAERSTPPPAL